MTTNSRQLLLVVLAAVALAPTCLRAAEMPADEAWKALPTYEPGQDMAALLAIDGEVIAAMKSPESRAACAAKLAELLGKDSTTLAAKQYVCLQLRQVGTVAEVPVLSKMLGVPETAEMARYALESVPGDEATEVLRNALNSSQDATRLGVVGSLAKRKDTGSVAALQKLAKADDPDLQAAAIRALGDIPCDEASGYLLAQAKAAGAPTPQVLAALLRQAAAGQSPDKVYALLSQSQQPVAFRRAGLEGLLRLEGDKAEATVLAWFSSDDPDRRRIAAGHLQSLSDARLDSLLAGLADLPDVAKLAVVELAASRRGGEVLPTIMTLVESSNPALKQAGIRCLGMIGEAAAIPMLLNALAAGR